jgi:hypothetical protein
MSRVHWGNDEIVIGAKLVFPHATILNDYISPLTDVVEVDPQTRATTLTAIAEFVSLLPSAESFKAEVADWRIIIEPSEANCAQTKCALDEANGYLDMLDRASYPQENIVRREYLTAQDFEINHLTIVPGDLRVCHEKCAQPVTVSISLDRVHWPRDKYLIGGTVIVHGGNVISSEYPIVVKGNTFSERRRGVIVEQIQNDPKNAVSIVNLRVSSERDNLETTSKKNVEKLMHNFLTVQPEVSQYTKNGRPSLDIEGELEIAKYDVNQRMIDNETIKLMPANFAFK